MLLAYGRDGCGLLKPRVIYAKILTELGSKLAIENVQCSTKLHVVGSLHADVRSVCLMVCTIRYSNKGLRWLNTIQCTIEPLR